MSEEHKTLKFPTDSTQKMLLLSLIMLPLIAWLGPLESLSFSYLDDTLTDAGLIYATARGINALASVIQTTELDAQFMSVQIGQLVDPLNDLIERFSSVMLVALGSLALQKILLELVTDTIFNLLLSGIAILAGTSLLMGNKRLYPLLVRAFWIAVFLRFSLVLVVIANSWVDAAFLADREAMAHRDMQVMESNLADFRSGVVGDEAAAKELRSASSELASLTKRLEKAVAIQRNLETEIALQEAVLDEARKESTGCMLLVSSKTCSPEVLQLSEKLGALETRLANQRETVDALDEQIEETTDRVDCLNRRSSGESCGIIDSIRRKMSIEQNLKDLQANMSDFVDTTVSLLMSLMLKTVAIPLLFIYCLFRALGFSWRRLQGPAHLAQPT